MRVWPDMACPPLNNPLSTNVSTRAKLLELAAEFAGKVCGLEGVERIALVGSLCTTKEDPKDIDVLLSLKPALNLSTLARISRNLKGRTQQMNKGADIFLVEAGQYIGRVCGYRQCFRRVLCRALHCGIRDHLNDDLSVLRLNPDLVINPPLEVWPKWRAHPSIPQDTREAFQRWIAH